MRDLLYLLVAAGLVWRLVLPWLGLWEQGRARGLWQGGGGDAI